MHCNSSVLHTVYCAEDTACRSSFCGLVVSRMNLSQFKDLSVHLKHYMECSMSRKQRVASVFQRPDASNVSCSVIISSFDAITCSISRIQRGEFLNAMV